MRTKERKKMDVAFWVGTLNDTIGLIDKHLSEKVDKRKILKCIEQGEAIVREHLQPYPVIQKLFRDTFNDYRKKIGARQNNNCKK